tara:strand:- start:407 stop:670 length:264 start_codon:yes stop_codon:yes gene_type:complete
MELDDFKAIQENPIVGQNTFFKFEIDVSKIFTVSDWDTIKDFNTLENRAALATHILQGNVKIKPMIAYGEEFHEDWNDDLEMIVKEV